METLKKGAFALFLAMSLVACGGTSDGDPTDDPDGDNGTDTTEQDAQFMGNYLLWHFIDGVLKVNRIIINTLDSDRTSDEGQPIYTGFDDNFQNISVDLTWSDTLGQYVMTHYTSATRNIIFEFSISDVDASISGINKIFDNGTLRSSENIDSSRSSRSELDSAWLSRSIFDESQSATLAVLKL